MYSIQQVSQGLSRIMKFFETVQDNLKYRIIYDQNEPALGDYKWSFVLFYWTQEKFQR